jgi:ATP-dependent Clp protease ATP-binding subunit ClpA
MDLNKFTIRSQQAIQQAQTIATGYGQQMLENGHLLKGILEVDPDVTPFLLKKLNVNLPAMTAGPGPHRAGLSQGERRADHACPATAAMRSPKPSQH